MVKVVETPPSSIQKFTTFFKKKSSYSVLILLFLVTATLITFKQLNFIQDIRQEASYNPSTKTFTETFDGDPATPQPFTQLNQANWDVQVHRRDRPYDQFEPMEAMHGMDCSAPPASHTTDGTYSSAVFNCKNHVMTAINEGGYGVIYLSPNAMIDFTNGGTVQFELSTFRSSSRDWWDVTVSPFNDAQPLPLLSDLSQGTDLQEPNKNSIVVTTDNGEGSPNIKVVTNGQVTAYGNPFFDMQTGITPGINQMATRQTFKLSLTKTHVKFERLASSTATAVVITEKDIPELSWSKGVVQFGHHSYNPSKACAFDGTCGPNTWHWDTITVNPAEPFTIIKTNKEYVDSNNTIVTLNAPAPTNAYLRFAGICKVKIDGVVASKMTYAGHPEHFSSYMVPIAQGKQSIVISFEDDDWYTTGLGCAAKDFAVWSQDQSINPTTSNQNPSNAPTPTATSATTTPTPTATSAYSIQSSIQGGTTLSGDITWTAYPIGLTTSKVDFLIDGLLKWTENTGPYQYNGDPDGVLDTTLLTNGLHQFTLKATASDGTVANFNTTVTVNNVAPSTTPSPIPTPSLTSNATGPSTVITGSSFTIASNITNTATSFTGNVIISLYDSGGVQSLKQQYSSQTFNTGQTKTYNTTWQLPQNASGFYTVKIQVTDSTGVTLYHYNSNALTFVVTTPTSTPTPTLVPTTGAWKGEYFNNRNLSGTPILVRNDQAINFNWGKGSPAAGIPADNFSVRWTKQEVFSGGAYTFTVSNDDGMIISVDGSVIYNNWRDQGASTRRFNTGISAGTHTVTVLYYEHAGHASAKVSWQKR